MHRNYKLYLDDILTSVNKIQNYVGDTSYEALLVDEMKLDAIVRNFEIIGEAASNIPAEIRDKYPFVEWWNIIKNKLPKLKQDIKTMIESTDIPDSGNNT